MTKQNLVQDLVEVFRTYELYLDRGRMTVKITGALLYIFQHIVGSKIGKQQFLDAGGLQCLKDFSHKPIFDDKRWDRILSRACTVLCKVCQAQPLPVEAEMCPAKFNVPDGHFILPELVESSSESTSRETTPESEDSDIDDEDNEDEDEEVAEQQDECNRDRDQALSDIETVPGKPIDRRDVEELAEQYSQYFQEYSTPSVSFFHH